MIPAPWCWLLLVMNLQVVVVNVVIRVPER